MKYFIDLEFVEDGTTIDVLSIGIAREDGQNFYCVNMDADWKKAKEHHFVGPNVLPNIYLIDKPTLFMRKKAMVNEARRFIEEFDKPESEEFNYKEFWAFYATYDWQGLCQTLFGPMASLPYKQYPMFIWDLKPLLNMCGNPKIPDNLPHSPYKGLHNALYDALWDKDVYDWLKKEYDNAKVSLIFP